jgi:hypothetical protein
MPTPLQHTIGRRRPLRRSQYGRAAGTRQGRGKTNGDLFRARPAPPAADTRTSLSLCVAGKSIDISRGIFNICFTHCILLCGQHHVR